MSKPIITIENLGKKYQLGEKENYLTIREQLTSFFDFKKRAPKKEFWALKNINLKIEEGEILGIIGPNGAGKSTLLKVLSRITPPTAGKVTMQGHVSSLLEVGTGFHPELTGRENIFLNGAILGMTQREIRKKFDAIVDFAEIAKFIDTPVKRYSSGMYVRLAFAVAAHLEPEILIIDEVLAVGDAQFQKKCLGKMSNVAKSGRTVLFVSHNMAAVNQLCQKCIFLNHGKIVDHGKTKNIIEKYLTSRDLESQGTRDLNSWQLRRNSLETSFFKFIKVRLLNSKNRPTGHLALNEKFFLEIKAKIKSPIDDLRVAFNIDSTLGFPLFNSYNNQALPTAYPAGEISFKVEINQNILAPGTYILGLGAQGTKVAEWIPEALTFSIGQISLEGKNINPDHGGILIYPCRWSEKIKI